MRQYDYMIVGQGIAGSAMAFALLRRGQRVLVVDQPQPFSSSKVAAGLFNPITGRHLAKTWLADEIFPYLHRFYADLERTIGGGRFFFPMPIYVPFSSIEKQNTWLAKASEAAYQPFIGDFLPHIYAGLIHQGEFGGVCLAQSGYLHTRAMLAQMRAWLHAQGALEEGFVENGSLRISPKSIAWHNITAKCVVFCDGAGAAGNALFSWLDFKLVKGDILDVRFEKAAFSHILNRGGWLIPVGGGRYRTGSNYGKDLDTTPTAAGRKEIEGKLEALVNDRYDVLDHQAGIRPATYDRRPFVGIHPAHSNVAMLGGLGSKGTSLAPYFAERLADALFLGKPLPAEVSLTRKNYS